MKKPALRKNRFAPLSLKKQTGQKVQKILANIFLEESLDQSNKELQNTRPMHLMSKLLITVMKLIIM